MINSKLQRTFQTIVYENNVDELIASISKVFYDTQDHNLKLDEWTKIAVFRHVSMSCSFTALSAFKLLNSLGVISRVAGVYSSKDFYHAHSLNEVYINNKWILVDFTKKIFICDENGNKLSLKEVYKKGGFSKCCLQLINNGYYSSNSGVDYRINNDGYMFNSSLISDFYSMCYPKNLQDWFNRFDIFMLSENPVYECSVLDNSNNNFKQHHHYNESYCKLIKEDKFFERFYNEYTN